VVITTKKENQKRIMNGELLYQQNINMEKLIDQHLPNIRINMVQVMVQRIWFLLEEDVDGDGVPDLVVGTNNDASVGAFDPSLMVYQWNSLYPQLPGYHKTPWVAAKRTL
jgi:hypothetical protein